MLNNRVDEDVVMYNAVYSAVQVGADLHEKLNVQGMDVVELAHGEVLMEGALKKFDDVLDERLDVKEVFEVYSAKRKAELKAYDSAWKRAKASLKGNELAVKELKLGKKKRYAYATAITVIKEFCKALLRHEDWAKKVYPYKLAEGETAVSLVTERLNALSELEALRVKYRKEQGDSQSAMEKREVAFEEADAWIKYLWEVCEELLGDDLQVLEGIERVIYGKNYRAKAKEAEVVVEKWSYVGTELLEEQDEGGQDLYRVELKWWPKSDVRWVTGALEASHSLEGEVTKWRDDVLVELEGKCYLDRVVIGDVRLHYEAGLQLVVDQANERYRIWWDANVSKSKATTAGLKSKKDKEEMALEDLLMG